VLGLLTQQNKKENSYTLNLRETVLRTVKALKAKASVFARML
jgi:hypothetical protein